MDIKQNPFSLYDFLGYFTPGALFLYGLMGAYAYTTSSTEIFNLASNKLGFDRAQIYIPFVLLAYTIGHVLSFLSSVTIERYSIWSLDYPSKYLLAISHKGYFEVEENKILRICLRFFIGVMLAPFTVIDVLIGWGLGYRALYAKKLDPLLAEIVLKKTIALLIYHGDMKDPPAKGNAQTHDFFRYVYHYVLEHAPNHLPKMQNYVALYGFLRTLTLISVFVCWGIVWQVCSGAIEIPVAVTAIIFSSLISFTLYVAFVKFSRRFTLEALMALVAIYELPPNNSTKADGLTGPQT